MAEAVQVFVQMSEIGRCTKQRTFARCSGRSIVDDSFRRYVQRPILLGPALAS